MRDGTVKRINEMMSVMYGNYQWNNLGLFRTVGKPVKASDEEVKATESWR
jgi:hypothetical protein